MRSWESLRLEEPERAESRRLQRTQPKEEVTTRGSDFGDRRARSIGAEVAPALGSDHDGASRLKIRGGLV